MLAALQAAREQTAAASTMSKRKAIRRTLRRALRALDAFRARLHGRRAKPLGALRATLGAESTALRADVRKLGM